MSDKIKEPVEQEQQDTSELLQTRQDRLTALQWAGKDPFEIMVCDRNAFVRDTHDQFEEIEGQDAVIADRIMSWHDMGKVNFVDIQDRTGRIQVYLKIDDIGEEAYHGLQNWGIGDLVSASDFVFRTRRGEILIHAKSTTLLGKSLLPLPDKFHDLKGTDLRYRQCYMDLIVNPGVKSTLEKRSRVTATIRRVLDERGYVEAETPVLNLIPGNAAARPFIIYYSILDLDSYLRITSGLYLRRLIAGGMGKVYKIGRPF